MNNRKKILFTLAGILFSASVTGTAVLASRSSESDSTRECNTFAVEMAGAGETIDYSVYEPYGLVYDQENHYYVYNGDVVRFFNDPTAGAGFTNYYLGTVDIEAERDQDHVLIGIKECSREVYEQHTEKYNYINSAGDMTDTDTAYEEGTSSQASLRDYEGYDVLYNEQEDGWYYTGQRIKLFIDRKKPLIYMDEQGSICISVIRHSGRISEIREFSEDDAQSVLHNASSVECADDTIE